MATTFDVTGSVGTPLTGLDSSKLASDFTPVTVSIDNAGTTLSYTGVPLYTLLTTANFEFPTTGVKNGFLRDYITISGTDGERVVVSEGEIDPSFGGVNASMSDIVAYQQDGTTITPTLIIPDDVNGGIGGRDVIDISGIVVGIANVPTPPPVTNPPPTVTLNGDVVSPGTAYTVSDVQALPVSKQTDTFLQGSTPKTFTFTGTPLISLLNSNGLTDSTPLDSYVVATGSDGYGVVYSMGEIDPTYRAGNVALVAYDDGTGTFPSISGGNGLFRTTAPFDSKGGRYVSNLETLAVTSAPCFAAGTRLATPDGPIAVEQLHADAFVLTASGNARPVRWIGHRRVDCARHPKPSLVWPVRIAAGAFGSGVPVRDLCLSPDHGVLIENVLIPIKYLANGISIVQEQRETVEYFHIELDDHDIIRAEGLPAESFLDTGQRSAFSHGGGAVALRPDFSARLWEAVGCAPLVVTGPALEIARQRLIAIAERGISEQGKVTASPR
jgi:hypothetical protein